MRALLVQRSITDGVLVVCLAAAVFAAGVAANSRGGPVVGTEIAAEVAERIVGLGPPIPQQLQCTPVRTSPYRTCYRAGTGCSLSPCQTCRTDCGGVPVNSAVATNEGPNDNADPTASTVNCGNPAPPFNGMGVTYNVNVCPWYCNCSFGTLQGTFWCNSLNDVIWWDCTQNIL
jgi:hypothetical protein